MLVDRYPPEDVLARVPELADQTDPVLVELDRLLDDEGLYQRVRADLARRYRLTPVHGRPSTPAEVILRLLVIQHLYAWSYQETVARVADSLVLRWFCRVYFPRVPDKATLLLRWAHTLRAATLEALVERSAWLATQARVPRARKLRSDSTCVQTTIHHPTDSGLLGDGVRVLRRVLRRVLCRVLCRVLRRVLRRAQPLVQDRLAGVRDAFRSRVRSARRALQRLHQVRRRAGADAAEAPRGLYTRLRAITQQTVRPAERGREAVAAVAATGGPSAPAGPARARERAGARGSARERAAHRLLAQFDRFLPVLQRGVQPARRRVLVGLPVASPQKVLSLFEPHTRVGKRGKIGAAVEFGRQVVLDEVEGGVVTRFHGLTDDESECWQALPAVRPHRAVFGRPPWLVTGDRRLHTKGVEDQAHALGVAHGAMPQMGRLSAAQRERERQRAWKRR